MAEGDAEAAESLESQFPRPRKAPSYPSAEAIAAHRISGHAVYRSWCRDCVQGRGRNAPHRTVHEAEAPTLPVISFDYGFLGSKSKADDPRCEREGQTPFIAYVDSRSEGVYAHMVPHKGIDFEEGELVVEAICRDLDSLGYKRVIFRSDGEPALQALLAAVKRRWDGEVVPQNSPPGESQSNGAAEKAVQTTKEVLRSVKFGLEFNLQCKIPDDHPLMSWMINYAVSCHRRYALKHSGTTAFENVNGRKPQNQMVELGEKVWWRPLQTTTKTLTSLDYRYEEGFFLGPMERTTAVLIATLDGNIVQSRALKRRPPEDRWDKEGLLKVHAIELQPNGPHSEDKRIHIRAPVFNDDVAEDSLPPRLDANPEGRPRRVYMTRSSFGPEGFGYTEGCPGCLNIKRGGGRAVTHSDRCRKRVEEIMRQDPAKSQRLQAAEKRITEVVGTRACDAGDAEDTQPKRLRRTQPLEKKLKRARQEVEGESQNQTFENSVPPNGSGNISGPQGDIETEDEWEKWESRKQAKIDSSIANDAPMQDQAMTASSSSGDPRGSVHSQPAKADDPDQDEVMMNLDIMLISSQSDEVTGEGHVSEIYSPPRVAPLAPKYGLKEGYSLDITTGDQEGREWDFDKRTNRARARRLIREKRPGLLIASPMCTHFSKLMAFNRTKMGELKYQGLMAKARRHLKFVIELCKEQLAHGGYFLFEHPAGASSWKEPEMTQLLQNPAVKTVICNMCRFGMTSTFQDGSPGLVFKPTQFATNSEQIARALDKKCLRDHAHAELVGGRAAAAQVYPPALCKAIILGMKAQVKEDESWMNKDRGGDSDMMHLEIDDSDLEDEPPRLEEDSDSDDDLEVNLHTEIGSCESGDDDWDAEDDVHGGKLDPIEVRKARVVEMQYVKDRKIYDYSTVKECYEATRAPPIGTKWVDTNKGDQLKPLYRSRLVAMEFRRKRTATIFAATPPLEAVRILMAILASRCPGHLKKGEKPFKLGLFDVSRAHFYADAARKVFVKLPPEDPRASEPGVCGILKKSMYGCRDAAALWEAHYSKVLSQAGFVKGRASPVCFHHPERKIWVVVHGDDFITVAEDEGIEYLEKVLSSSYAIKSSYLGSGSKDPKEIKALGRIITMHEWGIGYEPDPGHAEQVIDELGLSKAKEVGTPYVKPERPTGEERAGLTKRRQAAGNGGDSRHPESAESPPLDEERKKRYQSLAARLNYYSLDRPEILYSVKELMRKMSAPNEEDEVALKRVARFLVGQPRMVTHFPWKPLGKQLTTYVDSDFAGCARTRKSTSGGVTLWGSQLVKAWSKTQATLALSSGEAELAAVVRGSTESLGVQALLEDWGFDVEITIKSDATAAIGIVKRQGLGRVRHLAVADLWVQQKAQLGQLKFEKHPGKENPADMMTKGVDRGTQEELQKKIGMASMEGRSKLAPDRLKSSSASQ